MGAIEQYIKQKQFSCQHEKAHVGLLCASNLLMHHTQELLKKFNITLQQYNALRILRGQYPNPVNLGEIKARLIDKNSDTSRLIERLRKMELVDRVTCCDDRRAVDIRISEKGLDLLKKIDGVSTSTFFDIIKSLSDKEVEQLNIILGKLIEKGATIEYSPN